MSKQDKNLHGNQAQVDPNAPKISVYETLTLTNFKDDESIHQNPQVLDDSVIAAREYVNENQK